MALFAALVPVTDRSVRAFSSCSISVESFTASHLRALASRPVNPRLCSSIASPRILCKHACSVSTVTCSVSIFHPFFFRSGKRLLPHFPSSVNHPVATCVAQLLPCQGTFGVMLQKYHITALFSSRTNIHLAYNNG